ncbi:MAG: hypothetical protein M1609_02560 [Firmicutes bacterium]|nr:hypothetical protein [Bacillota bacterium]
MEAEKKQQSNFYENPDKKASGGSFIQQNFRAVITQNKRTVILIGFSFLLIIVALSTDYIKPSLPQKAAQNIPPVISKNAQVITEADQKALERDQQVADFIKGLPYHGKYFTVYYDISVNSFDVTIQYNNREKGDAEFADYLAKNNLSDLGKYYQIKTIYR